MCGEAAHAREFIGEGGGCATRIAPPPHGGTRAVRRGRHSLLALLIALLPLLPLVALGVLLLSLVPATGVVGVRLSIRCARWWAGAELAHPSWPS